MSDFIVATSHVALFLAAIGGGILVAYLIVAIVNRFVPRTLALIVNIGFGLMFVPLGIAVLSKFSLYEVTYSVLFGMACAFSGAATALGFGIQQVPLRSVRDKRTRQMVIATTAVLAIAYVAYLGACVYLDAGPRPDIAAYLPSACSNMPSLGNDPCSLDAAGQRWYRHASPVDRVVYSIRKGVGLERATYEGGLAQL